MLVERSIRFAGKSFVVGEGDLQWCEIFKVDGRWHQYKLTIGAVFDFDPHGLNLLLCEIDPKNLPGLFIAENGGRYPNTSAFLCRRPRFYWGLVY